MLEFHRFGFLCICCRPIQLVVRQNPQQIEPVELELYSEARVHQVFTAVLRTQLSAGFEEVFAGGRKKGLGTELGSRQVRSRTKFQ